jgi:PP-loop superfamily ATP-utilizing enzyme
MHRLGFKLVRVRWNNREVRLEISPEELPRAFELRDSISESLAGCGMQVVSLDICGYTSKGGSNSLE